MKALVNTRPGRLELIDWPTPEPGPGQVRVKTLACGICSTDLQMIAGWERTACPAIPGHEWSGVVDATGAGVDPRLVGERCVAENVFSDGGEVGFEHPGGYAEYLVTEARNLFLLPPGFPPEVGALIEPLAVCVHALARLRLTGQKCALVFGDGPIGLTLLLLLKQLGVEEIHLIGGFPNRLHLAEQLGAVQALDYHNLGADNCESPGSSAGLRQALGRSFSTLIEASGSRVALETALAVASHGAQILVMGDYSNERASFRWNSLLHQEIEFIGSNASAGAWPEAVRLAVSGLLPINQLVSHRFPIERFQEGIELAEHHKDSCVKVLLEWPQ